MDGRDDAASAEGGRTAEACRTAEASRTAEAPEADRAARRRWPEPEDVGWRVSGCGRRFGAGYMAPGQRLVEEELAALFGVTRASVRAALFDLTAQLVRHQFRLSLRPGRPQASLGEHLAIIDAIAAGRPAQAEEATRRHLRSVITALLDQGQAGNDAAAPGAGPSP